MHRFLALLLHPRRRGGSRGRRCPTPCRSPIGVLWRVERADGARQLRVRHPPFGPTSGSPALPQPVSDAFAASQTLAIECILDNPAIFKISRAMLLPGGERLDASMSAAPGHAPEGRVGGLSHALHHGDALQAVGRHDARSACRRASICAPPPASSRSTSGLRSEAEAAGKTVLGLETVDEQIDTLDGMGPADQMLMLDSTLQDVDRIESVFANLRDASSRPQPGGRLRHPQCREER